jgi:hypothetical protein
MGQTRADGNCIRGCCWTLLFADYSGRWKKKEEVYSIKGGDILFGILIAVNGIQDP